MSTMSRKPQRRYSLRQVSSRLSLSYSHTKEDRRRDSLDLRDFLGMARVFQDSSLHA